MPDWGKIFADPWMKRLPANKEVMALVPELKARGVRLVLDAGCGAGRHLLPLAAEGFQVLGVDREGSVLRDVKAHPGTGSTSVWLAQGDLHSLPSPANAFDFVLSVNAISHGDFRAFQSYCRELDRVLKPGGVVFIWVSPREAGEMMRLPETVELEPGTLVKISTPDGDLVHHFPTPESLAAQFPGYTVHRLETVQAPIPFMDGVELPQLVFLGEK
ncbi:MAG: class I SAM-dependent methyltransferase [Syntrophobacterales bacterium]